MEKILYQAPKDPPDYSRRDLTLRDEIRRAILVLKWFYKTHIQEWIRGYATTRDTYIERELKHLTKKKTLKTMPYGRHGRLAYSKRNKTDKRWFGLSDVYHYLQVSTCAVVIHRSILATGYETPPVIPEREFRGFGIVPELGFPLVNDMILLEFSTKHDFYYSGKMRGKFAGYRKNLSKINNDFFSRDSYVLFVLEVPREAVERISKECQISDPFYFVDYETFKKQPLGTTLQAPIYLYAGGEPCSIF